MKKEGVAIAAEDKGNVEGFGIAEGLLHSRAYGVVVVLGFDDREGDVGLVIENVIDALLRASSVDFSSHIDSTISETNLFANLGVEVPARCHEAGRDELRAYVAFTEGFFVKRFRH